MLRQLLAHTDGVGESDPGRSGQEIDCNFSGVAVSGAHLMGELHRQFGIALGDWSPPAIAATEGSGTCYIWNCMIG